MPPSEKERGLAPINSCISPPCLTVVHYVRKPAPKPSGCPGCGDTVRQCGRSNSDWYFVLNSFVRPDCGATEQLLSPFPKRLLNCLPLLCNLTAIGDGFHLVLVSPQLGL